MIRNSRLVKPSNEFVIFAEFNVTFKYLILGLHCSWWRWRRIWFCFTWTKFCYKKISNDFETSQICGQIIGSFWIISSKLSYLLRNGILFPNCSHLLWKKNCSCDWETLLKFEAEDQELAKLLRSLEQYIRTVKGQYNFWNRILF